MTEFEKIISAITALIVALTAALALWYKYRRVPEVGSITVEALPARRKRILIVDDEPSLSEIVRQTLIDDYNISTEVSPYEALSKIFERYERGECYDLIILDERFNDTDLTDSDMAHIIKFTEDKQGLECKTKVVLLSGIGIILPKREGVLAVWHKPHDLMKLKVRVKAILEQKGTSQ